VASFSGGEPVPGEGCSESVGHHLLIALLGGRADPEVDRGWGSRGRSSGFGVIRAAPAFPNRLLGSVAFEKQTSPVTAAQPLPICP